MHSLVVSSRNAMHFEISLFESVSNHCQFVPRENNFYFLLEHINCHFECLIDRRFKNYDRFAFRGTNKQIILCENKHFVQKKDTHECVPALSLSSYNCCENVNDFHIYLLLLDFVGNVFFHSKELKIKLSFVRRNVVYLRNELI